MGIARFKIHEGKVEEFKRLSAEAMEIVKTKDTGTLRYDTSFNDDESECVMLEFSGTPRRPSSTVWPLLTPMGSFFAQLESGELAGQPPWAAILGFADVIMLMAAAIWLARRRERKLDRPSDEKPSAHRFEVRVVGSRG